ncbi:type 2 isopentenyl-diphosphate Delta-isomerase [Clostridium sp. D2Q-11]|uniref:Isopentenyl-diphosphate delta-isomerase n=1 Tax=Anaeromonas frigoriresistens TaxID=2683708 RepID=A0A942UQD9_9FIRM|nr:type 2 isopentenyl-diphosphate Delta-isomerase [Anaeromonas frigoriresistens]MBS4537374.1 type 2 isopentenyl-diphosphate Delta-isomerase [Anaeromonas frigoriresistens]
MEELNSKSKIRSSRKKDHVNHILKDNFESDNYFKDIYLEHNSLPELDFAEISTKSSFLGKDISFPVMINAMTGGFDKAVEINSNLAKIARELNIPMAVGSQTIAIKDKNYEASFKIVREVLKDGVVISNVNAFVSVDEARRAMEMIQADAIQIHLNPAQEICMPEGDRDFKGVLNNIEDMVKKIDKPVIVKEVGFGISKDVATRLRSIGVKYIDVGGHGGTNFIKVENARNEEFDFYELFEWGIPTALSLIETRAISNDLNIISTGGMRTANEVVKALCVGADIIGISGPVLKKFVDEGYESAEKYLQNIIYKSKVIMLLLGKKNIGELKNVPYRIKGELKELLDGAK